MWDLRADIVGQRFLWSETAKFPAKKRLLIARIKPYYAGVFHGRGLARTVPGQLVLIEARRGIASAFPWRIPRFSWHELSEICH